MDLSKNSVSSMEETLRRQKWALEERVKELDCLYRISRLLGDKFANLALICGEAVSIIPTAWQYPEITRASISMEGETYSTEGFTDSGWLQESPIRAGSRCVGRVAVCYTQDRPAADEGPFLAEERRLLDTVAQLLGEVIERKWAEDRLKLHQEMLRSMTATLALSEQRERRRLAETLHDRIGQKLAMVSMKLGGVIAVTADETGLRMLADIRGLVSGVISDTRTLTFELSPPVLYELGLSPALGWLAEQVGASTGLVVEFREGACDVSGIGEELRVLLYQSVRELLMNVYKHAGAQWVCVAVSGGEGRIAITVEDDGKGFDPDRAVERARDHMCFGLFSIRERLEYIGGSMAVSSAAGRGTKITLVAPADMQAAGGGVKP